MWGATTACKLANKEPLADSAIQEDVQLHDKARQELVSGKLLERGCNYSSYLRLQYQMISSKCGSWSKGRRQRVQNVECFLVIPKKLNIELFVYALYDNWHLQHKDII